MTSRQLVQLCRGGIRGQWRREGNSRSRCAGAAGPPPPASQPDQPRLAAEAEAIAQHAAAMALPEDLDAQIRALLDEEPALSWDQALVRLIG
jgi:hypothetical protein